MSIAPADSEKLPSGSLHANKVSLSVIVLTQFVFLSLGLMAVTIVVKVSGGSEKITPLASFLATYGMWLIVTPLLWLLGAYLMVWANKGQMMRNLAAFSGILMAGAILVVFGWAVLSPTR